MNINYLLECIFTVASHPLRKTYIADVCRHKTKKKGLISRFKKSCIVTMPLHKVSGNPNYCLDCIAEMTIVCANCGMLIAVGDPIMLGKLGPEHKIPEQAVKVEEAYICCLGPRCGEWMTRCGIWSPPGKINRIPSPIEELLMSGGRAIVCLDTNNPNEHGTIVQ